MTETRDRILDVALDTLGQDPDAGMADIAAAAGVVRRTVYGHFPSRTDLVLALTRRAVDEMASVLAEIDDAHDAADEAWAAFIARLWPLVRRYRVLVVLRRSEYGPEIHALLGPVERRLADVVGRGQRTGAFGRHLPAGVLSQVAWTAVFAIADAALAQDEVGARAAATTSLLMLGVPEPRTRELVEVLP